MRRRQESQNPHLKDVPHLSQAYYKREERSWSQETPKGAPPNRSQNLARKRNQALLRERHLALVERNRERTHQANERSLSRKVKSVEKESEKSIEQMTIRLLSQNGLEYKFNLTPRRKPKNKKKRLKAPLRSIETANQVKSWRKSMDENRKKVKIPVKKLQKLIKQIAVMPEFSKKIQILSCQRVYRKESKYEKLLLKKNNLKILKPEDIKIKPSYQSIQVGSSQELLDEEFDMNFIRSGFTPESGNSIFKSAGVKKQIEKRFFSRSPSPPDDYPMIFQTDSIQETYKSNTQFSKLSQLTPQRVDLKNELREKNKLPIYSPYRPNIRSIQEPPNRPESDQIIVSRELVKVSTDQAFRRKKRLRSKVKAKTFIRTSKNHLKSSGNSFIKLEENKLPVTEKACQTHFKVQIVGLLSTDSIKIEKPYTKKMEKEETENSNFSVPRNQAEPEPEIMPNKAPSPTKNLLEVPERRKALIPQEFEDQNFRKLKQLLGASFGIVSPQDFNKNPLPENQDGIEEEKNNNIPPSISLDDNESKSVTVKKPFYQFPLEQKQKQKQNLVRSESSCSNNSESDHLVFDFTEKENPKVTAINTNIIDDGSDKNLITETKNSILSSLVQDEPTKDNVNLIRISNFSPMNKKRKNSESQSENKSSQDSERSDKNSEVKRSFQAVQGFFISASKQNSSIQSPKKVVRPIIKQFKPVIKKVPYFEVGPNVKHSFNDSSVISVNQSKETFDQANTVLDRNSLKRVSFVSHPTFERKGTMEESENKIESPKARENKKDSDFRNRRRYKGDMDFDPFEENLLLSKHVINSEEEHLNFETNQHTMERIKEVNEDEYDRLEKERKERQAGDYKIWTPYEDQKRYRSISSKKNN